MVLRGSGPGQKLAFKCFGPTGLSGSRPSIGSLKDLAKLLETLKYCLLRLFVPSCYHSRRDHDEPGGARGTLIEPSGLT